MTDGEKLKEIRRVISQREECTQAKFAQMIGTTRSTVARMESGIRNVSDSMKRKIYHATGAMLLDEFEWPVGHDNENAPYERFTLKHYWLHQSMIEGTRLCPCCLRPYRD